MPDLFRRARSLARALAPEHSCIVISTPALPDPTYDASRSDPPLPCLIYLYMLLVQLRVVLPQSFVQSSFQSALPPGPPFHLIQRWVTVRACPSLHDGVTITPHPGGVVPWSRLPAWDHLLAVVGAPAPAWRCRAGVARHSAAPAWRCLAGFAATSGVLS